MTLVETTREQTRSNLIATNNVTCQRIETPIEGVPCPRPKVWCRSGRISSSQMLSTCLEHRFDPIVRLFVSRNARTEKRPPFRGWKSSVAADESTEGSENIAFSRQSEPFLKFEAPVVLPGLDLPFALHERRDFFPSNCPFQSFSAGQRACSGKLDSPRLSTTLLHLWTPSPTR